MRLSLLLASFLLLPACASYHGGSSVDEGDARLAASAGSPAAADDEADKDVAEAGEDDAVVADLELIEAIETGKAKVDGPNDWDGLKVSRLGRYHFSGQPDAAALKRAAAEGVTVVVNLKEESEMTWDEAQAVKDAGLLYYHIPVPAKGAYDQDAFAEVNAVQERHGGKILIHCEGGTRAAAWFASYLTTQQNIALDKALALGQQLGMKGDSQVARVQDFIEQYDSENARDAEDGDAAP